MADQIGNSDSVRYSFLGNQDPDDEDLLNGDEVIAPAITHTNPRKMSFIRRLRGSQRILFLLILVSFLFLIIWLLSNMETGISSSNLTKVKLLSDGSKGPGDLQSDMDAAETYNWYQTNCYQNDNLGRSIADIYVKLQILRESAKEECRLIWNTFDGMLRIESISAPISLPVPFQQEVKGWLNNDKDLFEQVNHQVVYKVTNKGTFEETVFNPIRSKRPQSVPAIDPLVYIRNLTETSKPSCDFCRYKEHTAEDTFGRIDNEYSASCSNTFKLAKFHALFFPKQHSPLNLTLVQIEDLFLHTSKEWFAKAYETDPRQIYPSLMWDSLPHAGASQVHPHVHGVLYQFQYVGGFESWHQVSLKYFKKWRRSFWTDFVKLHFALGLGLSQGGASIILPLTARKDHEFMIISPSLNKDVASMIHRVLQTYQNQLGVYCFSGGGVYPKMRVDDEDTGMPIMFRFGARGACTSVGSDVSSLELYTINNVNTDLAKTYQGLLKQSGLATKTKYS